MVRELYSKSDIPFKFIHSAGDIEIGYMDKNINMDMDMGSTDDFKMEISYPSWKNERYRYNDYVFIPGTEFGGIVNSIQSVTKSKKVTVEGRTWRGLLRKKIVEPPLGNEYLILNGELSAVVRELIGERFDSLFVVPNNLTGVTVKNWKVDRYIPLLDALNKLLDNYKYKLKIVSVEQTEHTPFYVNIIIEPIKDYTNEIEYSGRHYADLNVKDYRGGINHLICVGEGQGTERIVQHLYVQANGSIGKSQFYFGLDEIAAVYNYSSADAGKLVEDGTKRLKELMNSKQVKATAKEVDVDIGDIIAGYDEITNTSVAVPVVGKILKFYKGKIKIEHRTKGER